MKNMGYCPTCGQMNQDDAKFCRYCGSTLEESPKGTLFTSQSTESTSIGFGNRPTGENLVMRCTMCGSQDFAKDTGRLDSKWGWTSFKVIMLSCKRCGHIELFNKGRSIWDFD